MTRTLANIEDVAPFFLNPEYCTAEMIIFILVKEGLDVELRLKNMRRVFPSGSGLPND